MIKKALCLALFGLLLPAALGETFVPCGNLLPDYDPYAEARGSTYVPMDSWIYRAMDRLHALGQVDIAYIGMKPWTRLSIVHMLEAASSKMEETTADSEACRIYHSVQQELQPDFDSLQNAARLQTKLASVYTRFDGISGTPLRDSYHLGQSIINDYGRPYEQGFNSVAGLSTRMEDGRFAFYLRGEYQHAPSAAAITCLLSLAEGDKRKTKYSLPSRSSWSSSSLGAVRGVLRHLHTAGNQAETLTGRTGIWAYVLTAALEQPLIGHGFDSMWKVIPPFGPEQFEARHGENELLTQFYAFGIVGICLLIGIYGSLYRQIRRLPRGPLRIVFLSLLLFVVVRGLAEAEAFDLLLPLWSIVLISLLVERTSMAADPTGAHLLARGGDVRSTLQPLSIMKQTEL